MAQKLPERAIDSRFSSECYDPDSEGIYTVVEYRRKDKTLYLRSTLSTKIGNGQYRFVTLSFYDETGDVHLNDVVWQLDYDVNLKIVSKKVK